MTDRLGMTSGLVDFLGDQRWFAGKGRPWRVERTTTLGWLRYRMPAVRIELVRVAYDDDQNPGTEDYQLALVHYDGPVDHLSHAFVTEVTDADGNHSWVYDALHDKNVTGLWLRGVITAGQGEGPVADLPDVGNGDLGDVGPGKALTFHSDPNAPEVPLDVASIVSGAEQSNTSLIYGDVVICKVFRKIAPGLNPDIEVHAALASVGSAHIAAPLGWLEGRWTDVDSGQEVTGSLAMLQEFLANASEGWNLAKTSVRDLFAEADLHADEVGGDFAGESHRLGAATAEVHRDLARTLPTGVLGPGELKDRAADMRRRLDQAVAVVPELAPHAPSLATAYDDLAELGVDVPVQRVHGDYHLGQVLRTLDGWRLIDFEGEPARPLDQRRELDSPLRDVAGMLRSLDYAAWHLLAGAPRSPQREYRAAEWAERNRSAFCEGYAEAAGADPRDSAVLLRALETDKAVYEAVYEARNRPSWLRIPMSAVTRLADVKS